MNSSLNEALIRDVVSEVLGRLGRAGTPVITPAAPASACGCNGNGKSNRGSVGLRGRYGVFSDPNEACAAAHEAYLQLQQKGVAARRKVEQVITTLCDKNAEAWGTLELDETMIGRLDHKIEKLKS